MKLFHVTTEKKAKYYRMTGHINKPVRGFSTLMGAMAWAVKVNRTVIYAFDSEVALKLPDHHNQWGNAYWCDEDVSVDRIKCVFSAVKDA